MKRTAALTLGIVFGFLGLFAVTTNWEPHSAVVKAHKFAIVAFLLCFLLVGYGVSRNGTGPSSLRIK